MQPSMAKKMAKKKNKANEPKKKQPKKTNLLQEIFNPTYIKFIGIATTTIVALALIVRGIKTYLLRNKATLLSPGQFVEHHGTMVMAVICTMMATVVFVRVLYYRVLAPLLFQPRSSNTLNATKKRNRNRGMPRIATQAFTFTLYQGDRPWEPEEQSLFEQQLSQMGVPTNDQEWAQFAHLMNTERTGVHLKFRYKALTKALQEQENNTAASASTSISASASTAEDEEENLLKWWLEIGLKDFDEKNEVLENQMYVYDEKEDEYEYDTKNDSEDNQVDEDNEQRVEIELTPKRTGLEIALEGNVLLWKMGTNRIDSLRLQIQCQRCNTSRDLQLSGTWESQRERCVWCSKCKCLLRVGLRPMLLHASNHIICHVDRSDTVDVLDVLPSSFSASCEVCSSDKETMFTQFQRGKRMERNCLHCGTKLAMFAKQFVLKDVDVLSGRRKKKSMKAKGASNTNGSGGSSSNSIVPQVRLVKGENLPNMGACKHFKKSLKWMRFSCCGKVFPCPICHELNGECENASTALASRLICGKCSEEQPYTNGKCTACSFHMGKGGRDTRQATMSKKDRKKKAPSSSSSKKTVSKKSSRVGAVGKKKREKQKLAKQIKHGK